MPKILPDMSNNSFITADMVIILILNSQSTGDSFTCVAADISICYHSKDTWKYAYGISSPTIG